MPFDCQSLGYFRMRSELTSVVGCDGLDVLSVREQQPDHGLCRRGGLSPLLQPLHQDKVRGALRQGEYGMAVRVHDGVFLPVAETFAVGFGRAFVVAGAVGDVGCPGRSQPPRMLVVLQLVWHVLGQSPRLVSVDVVVDCLLAYAYAFLMQHTGNLPWRPVFLNHTVNAPPQFFRLAVVASEAVLAFLALGLSIFSHVAAVRLRVVTHFTADRRFRHHDFIRYAAFAPFSIQAKINCVPLCLG